MKSKASQPTGRPAQPRPGKDDSSSCRFPRSSAAMPGPARQPRGLPSQLPAHAAASRVQVPLVLAGHCPGSFLTRGAGDERVSGRACLKRTRFISPCGARHRTPGWKSRPWKQSGGSTCSGPGAHRRRRGPRLFVPRMRQAWAGHLMEPFHAETSVLQLVGRNVDVSLISLPQVIKTKQQNLGNEAH